jgi:hypothetical protein
MANGRTSPPGQRLRHLGSAALLAAVSAAAARAAASGAASRERAGAVCQEAVGEL